MEENQFKFTRDNSEMDVITPWELDEAGLTTVEHRVYIHICRRVGLRRNGRACDSSVSSISKTCKVSERSVQYALRSLEDKSMIVRHIRENQTSVYDVTPVSSWTLGGGASGAPGGAGGAPVQEVHPNPKGKPKDSSRVNPRGDKSPLGASPPSDPIGRSSPHQDFINGWVGAYEQCFGKKYLVAGAKDGTAVKRLLSTGEPWNAILMTAVRSWGRASFNCKQSTTISGFASRYNEICHEWRLIDAGIDPEKPFGAQIRQIDNEISQIENRLSGAGEYMDARPPTDQETEQLKKLRRTRSLLKATPSS